MKNSKIIGGLGLVVVSTIMFYLFYSEGILEMASFPSTIHKVSDEFDGGNTEVEVLPIENGFGFEFTLRKSEGYPYAGAKYIFDSLQDVSDYSLIRFKIQGSKVNKVSVAFGERFDDGTILPVLFLENQLDIDTTLKEVEISLDDFTPPAWWLNNKGLEEGQYPPKDYTDLATFGVSNGNRSKIDVKEKIIVKDIEFVKKRTLPYYFFGLGGLSLIFLLIKNYVNSRKKEPLKIEYEPVKKEEKEQDVITFISSNYMRPEMGSNFIQDSLGISESKVTSEVKKDTGLTLKQFINQLRIEEAKRLLKNSDLRINEIAYEVGYDNVTHFNRTFKSMTDLSPSNYRKT